MLKKIFLLFVAFFNFGFITQFGLDVNDSIDRGLQYLRQTQNADGGWGRPTGLAVLCFLEKRVSADFNAQVSGYNNMSVQDQEIVRKGIKYCIDNIPGISINNAESYDAGSCMMAMSSYYTTGGPDLVGARMSVLNAINHSIQTMQILQSVSDRMGFAYNNNNRHTDMSTTQFGMAGLYALGRINHIALNTLSLARSYIMASRNNNGGSSYQPGGQITHAMTASGLWTLLLSGLSVEDNFVQQSLIWLRDNYNYNNNGRIGDSRSYFYYLWASAKAFEVSTGNNQGSIYGDQIGGVIDPVTVGYNDESARWYFDYAFTLINIQNNDGSWCNSNYQCWNNISATSYALLVLMRSLGGVCIGDVDLDENCDIEDNCPNVSNPDQSDVDGDGIGDVCDNCQITPNVDQLDVDFDNIGDVCDPIICIQQSQNDECNGIDDDCDGLIDEDFIENDDNLNIYCSTGLRGLCNYGSQLCINGIVECIPIQSPTVEVCNFFDEDCDGTIDENLLNTCGECGALQSEVCNGLDDDCNGEVDNGEYLCGDYSVCYMGECRNRCDIECPQYGTFCNQELDICLYPCDTITCERNQTCINEQYSCIDLCENVICNNDLICWQGECVLDSCLITGCDTGSICYDNECIPDVCAAIKCNQNEFCRYGQCIPSCAYISCSYNEICFDGLCIEDENNCLMQDCNELCLNIDCDISDICFNGVCMPRQCSNIICPFGQECEETINGAQCIRIFNEDVLNDQSVDEVEDMFIIDIDFNQIENKFDAEIEKYNAVSSVVSGCNNLSKNNFNINDLLIGIILIVIFIFKKVIINDDYN